MLKLERSALISRRVGQIWSRTEGGRDCGSTRPDIRFSPSVLNPWSCKSVRGETDGVGMTCQSERASDSKRRDRR